MLKPDQEPCIPWFVSQHFRWSAPTTGLEKIPFPIDNSLTAAESTNQSNYRDSIISETAAILAPELVERSLNPTTLTEIGWNPPPENPKQQPAANRAAPLFDN